MNYRLQIYFAHEHKIKKLARSETYYTKRIKLQKQYDLYDDFLMSTKLPPDQRRKLIYEMGRMIHTIEVINQMPLLETKKKTDDYPLFIPSGLNEKILPLKL